MHEGVHIWLDTCIAEILPAVELEERETSAGLRSQAVFLHEAKPGTRGELVVTTFGEALPLIRYRQVKQLRLSPTNAVSAACLTPESDSCKSTLLPQRTSTASPKAVVCAIIRRRPPGSCCARTDLTQLALAFDELAQGQYLVRLKRPYP